ncbi:hypothetical protein BC831DRAFT_22678 [Entophlyctis helioformis]|nr:hypothetical protein BC831DRAFT_22678 [Entophlyctis helioformis]
MIDHNHRPLRRPALHMPSCAGSRTPHGSDNWPRQHMPSLAASKVHPLASPLPPLTTTTTTPTTTTSSRHTHTPAMHRHTTTYTTQQQSQHRLKMPSKQPSATPALLRHALVLVCLGAAWLAQTAVAQMQPGLPFPNPGNPSAGQGSPTSTRSPSAPTAAPSLPSRLPLSPAVPPAQPSPLPSVAPPLVPPVTTVPGGGGGGGGGGAGNPILPRPCEPGNNVGSFFITAPNASSFIFAGQSINVTFTFSPAVTIIPSQVELKFASVASGDQWQTTENILRIGASNSSQPQPQPQPVSVTGGFVQSTPAGAIFSIPWRVPTSLADGGYVVRLVPDGKETSGVPPGMLPCFANGMVIPTSSNRFLVLQPVSLVAFPDRYGPAARPSMRLAVAVAVAVARPDRQRRAEALGRRCLDLPLDLRLEPRRH